MNNLFKNAGAIFAGLLTVMVLSILTDSILEAIHFFPPTSAEGLFDTNLLIIALIYRSIYTVLGGYVTSKLSPTGSSIRNVIILGVIGTVLGILGVIAGWNLSQHWYPIALAVLGFPCVWIGGKLDSINK